MSIKDFSFVAFALATMFAASSCEDEVSQIGGSIFDNDATIRVDSTLHNLRASTLEAPELDTRSVNNMLGRINTPEYGDLRCSFIARLLSAAALSLPDSISGDRIDGMSVTLTVPRGAFTGDSLAPQQATLYKLTTPLPSDATEIADPEQYCDLNEPWAKSTYTLSKIASNDSTFIHAKSLDITFDLPRQWALQIVDMYRGTQSEIFQWPDTFAEFLKGIYVQPTFGKGCIANISAVNFWLKYNYRTQSQYKEDDEVVTKVKLNHDSISIFSTAPEVLCLNSINYQPSEYLKNLKAQGKKIITTPGGYIVDFRFPAKEFIEEFRSQDYNLAIVSSLSLQIPANKVKNELNIGVAPYLLMVKRSEYIDFIKEARIPDGKTSFYASYNSTTGKYTFGALRRYLLDLLDRNSVKPEDEEFVLIPVQMTIETETNSSGQVTGTYVTRCAPYQSAPTMTVLDTDHATIAFTFTQQVIK